MEFFSIYISHRSENLNFKHFSQQVLPLQEEGKEKEKEELLFIHPGVTLLHHVFIFCHGEILHLFL